MNIITFVMKVVSSETYYSYNLTICLREIPPGNYFNSS